MMFERKGQSLPVGGRGHGQAAMGLYNAVAVALMWAGFAAGPCALAQESEEPTGIFFAPDDDEAAPKPAAPNAGDDANKPAPVTPQGVSEPVTLRRRQAHDSIFGSYRIRVGAARPDFDEGRLKLYDKMYGSEKIHPVFGAAWFAWDWYATLGLTFQTAYYRAEGFAARGVGGNTSGDNINNDTYTKDPAGPLTLTLIPVQAALAAEFTPFDKKWLVLDAWAGMEWMYWQEVRTSGGTSSGLAAATGTDSDANPTNRGWGHGKVFGGAVNILLNGLDPASAASMRGVMGIDAVYISPYVEFTVPYNSKGNEPVTFARRTVGVVFTFETYN